MSSRHRLLHDWTAQLTLLLPEARVTRVRGLALFALGLMLAGRITLLRIAAALPRGVADLSTERQLRRWLANDAVEVTALAQPLRRALLAGRAGTEIVLVFDPTPHRSWATILLLGVVQHKRVLPVAWRVVPQQTAWPERLGPLFAELAAEVVRSLPPGCAVTVVADRGLVGPALVDACRAVGWDLVLRLRAGAGEASRVRLADGTERRLAELVRTAVPRPGRSWTAPVALFKQAGWRTGHLTVRWETGRTEPWVLFSDRPGGPARVREYRRRALAEATYADGKGRGFTLETSRVTDPARLDRLLLVVAVAYWWAHQLGLRAVRQGHRPRFDRTDRRDLSITRLGRRALEAALAEDRCPPLPFHRTPTGWSYAWLD